MNTVEYVGAYVRTNQHPGEEEWTAQVTSIERYCDQHDWQIGWINGDVTSGAAELGELPGLVVLLDAQAKFGFTKVLVSCLTRISRSCRQVAMVQNTLAARGCKIVQVA